MKTRLVHAALGASLLAGVSPAGAGETAFKPFLGIAEEFTDNVENIDKARRHDFITRVTPGFSGRYRSSLWDWNGSFMLDYRYYARNSRSEDTTSVVDLKGKVAVVENLLFLEVSDVYKRVSLDVARDFTQESLFRNQADTNVVTVSPYVLVRWKERTELRAGYRFEDIRYFSANVTVPEETPVEVRNRTDHTVFAGISHALTPRSSLTADYSFRRELISSRDNVLHVALLGWEGKYGEKSGIKLQAGYGRLEFDGPREGGASLTWNAELKHEAGPMKYLLSSGVNYIPNPLGGAARETRYRGEVVRATERNTVSVNGGYSIFNTFGEEVLGDFRFLTTGDRKSIYAGASLAHALTPSLKGTVSVAFDRLLRDDFSRSDRVTTATEIAWTVGKNLTLRGSWTRTETSSPIAGDERFVNRVGVEVRKEWGA